MGMNSYTRQQYANRDFIGNCLFYLTGGKEVIAARSKIFRLRLIDKEKMENQKFFWQSLNIVFPLFLLGLFYFFNALIRKKKYARQI
jgi:ABC-2 type transport system permease protein